MVGGSWLVEVNTMAWHHAATPLFFKKKKKKKNGNDWLQLIFICLG
jgi:hypothetical protein